MAGNKKFQLLHHALFFRLALLNIRIHLRCQLRQLSGMGRGAFCRLRAQTRDFPRRQLAFAKGVNQPRHRTPSFADLPVICRQQAAILHNQIECRAYRPFA
jgi:hypothetical protein